MSAISQKSITGITSITTPTGVDNQLTLHTNNTTERVKIDVAGNVHVNNHISIAGITTTTDDINIDADNKKLQIGDGQDLELFHDGGTLSYIRNNTGKLVLRSDTFQFGTQDGAHRYIDIPTDEQGVSLFYDNNQRLATTSTGAQIDTILKLYGAAGNPGKLQLQEGGAISEIRVERSTDTSSALLFGTEISGTTSTRAKIDTAGHFIPATDSTYDLGLTGTRWRNVYADTLYGDGSNLTGIAADKIFEGNTEVETVDTGSNGHIKFTTEGTERLRIDLSGHMGLGVTPSAWPTNGDYKGFQIGTGACIFGRGSGDEDRGGIGVNYYGTTAGAKYIANGHAARFYMADGVIQLQNADQNSSGAGAAMTLNTRLQVASDGKIDIGGSTRTGNAARLTVTHTNNSGVGLIDIDAYGSATLQIRSNWSGSTINGMPNETFGIGTPHAYPLVFTTSGAEQVRISPTGQLLVGTTSSQYHFHVDDTEKAAEISIDNDASNYKVALNTTNSVNADFNIQHKANLTSIGTGVNVPLCFHINGSTNANSAEKMRLEGSGNLVLKGGNLEVGLDSATVNFTDSDTNGSRYVEVGAAGGGSGGDALFVAHSSGSGVAYFGYESGGDRLVIATDSGGGNNKIDFITDAGTSTGGSTDNLNAKVPKMRIEASGDVAINNTDPKAKLDVRGNAIIADDIGSVPSTFPPADTQLLVYTSTNGQPITNTNCARLCIATDAKQVGAQGYNGAIDFGNSDVTASGSNAQYNWRVASIMSNAAGDTGNDPTADGDLQFWTKTTSGNLTQNFRIGQDGKLYKSGNQFYPLVNYVETTTFSGVNVSSSSYTDLRVVYSNYTPKKAGNRIVIHHQSQMWNGQSGQGNGDVFWRIMRDEGSGYSAFVTNERILGNHDGWNNSGGYSGLARHHRTVHLMGSFVCNGNTFNLKTQGRSMGIGWDWYHDSNNILQIWEYDIS